MWPKYSGVKHGDEIEFTFGRPLTNPDNYNADEISFAHDVVTYWTNFAKTGYKIYYQELSARAQRTTFFLP